MNPRVKPLRDGDPKNFQGWALKGLIGEGGQSTIYLAEKNGQLAALKMIRKEYLYDAKSVDRFSTEIKNLELLDHPNIARLLEVEDSGRFFAIEFVEGLNLEEFVDEYGPLDFEQWSIFARKIADALEYCHAKGVVHKDISPRNIVMGESGPMLIDFGISHLETDPRLTSDDETIGTPPFMSPEHFGISAPKEMDTFSLGGTLIFAGTGHYPFRGETKSEWRDSILFDLPNFSGLSDQQIGVLSPLLYKRTVERGSLKAFTKLLSEVTSGSSQSGVVTKVFAKVKRESQSKLTQEKKQHAVKRLSLGKFVSAATIISIISIGIVSLGIVNIQDSGSTIKSSSSASVERFPISPSSAPSFPASPNVSIGAGSQPDKSSSSRACEQEYDRKGKDIIDVCLPFATKGDPASIFYVGVTYFDKQNYKEAEKWLLLGAKAQDLNSTKVLIQTYTQLSNTVERDRWTKICADTNYGATDTSPLKDIAYCKMLHGFILTRAGANKEAILYLTDAAEYGNGDAAAWLGNYYRNLEDRENTIKWLTKAAELESSDGLKWLISYADEIGDDALAKKWLLVSANSGNQVNMGVLALFYYYDKDLSSAKKWAVKGASFGDVLSIYVQGAVAYDQGKKVEGKELLVKAANKGNISAIRKLGSIYRLDEKDYEAAAIWYEKLAARNDFTGTDIYSALLFMLGKDKESCMYVDKVLELGNAAKKNGTYEPSYMDAIMADAKTTSDGYCTKMYKNS